MRHQLPGRIRPMRGLCSGGAVRPSRNLRGGGSPLPRNCVFCAAAWLTEWRLAPLSFHCVVQIWGLLDVATREVDSLVRAYNFVSSSMIIALGASRSPPGRHCLCFVSGLMWSGGAPSLRRRTFFFCETPIFGQHLFAFHSVTRGTRNVAPGRAQHVPEEGVRGAGWPSPGGGLRRLAPDGADRRRRYCALGRHDRALLDTLRCRARARLQAHQDAGQRHGFPSAGRCLCAPSSCAGRLGFCGPTAAATAGALGGSWWYHGVVLHSLSSLVCF